MPIARNGCEGYNIAAYRTIFPGKLEFPLVEVHLPHVPGFLHDLVFEHTVRGVRPHLAPDRVLTAAQ